MSGRQGAGRHEKAWGGQNRLGLQRTRQARATGCQGGESGGRGSGPPAACVGSWVFTLMSPEDRHWDREQMGSQDEAVVAEH